MASDQLSTAGAPRQDGQSRISLIGPSGAGKSTVAMFIQRIIPDSIVVSIAQPLRDIEEHMYDVLDRPSPRITGAQDGRMLQDIRDMLIQRDPDVLKRRFIGTLDRCTNARLIVNDDCRRAMKPELALLGFRFIYIDAKHKSRRPDTTGPSLSQNPHDQLVGKDDCDIVLRNTGDLHALINEVRTTLMTVGVLN